MKTPKWIKGLIYVLGGLILSTIISMFATGGHPILHDWQLLGTAVISAIASYIALPQQTDPSPWGSINWKDFFAGLLKTAGAALGPVLLLVLKAFPKTMGEWWVIIGICVGYFGQYILKALFTNSNGKVSLTVSP